MSIELSNIVDTNLNSLTNTELRKLDEVKKQLQNPENMPADMKQAFLDFRDRLKENLDAYLERYNKKLEISKTKYPDQTDKRLVNPGSDQYVKGKIESIIDLINAQYGEKGQEEQENPQGENGPENVDTKQTRINQCKEVFNYLGLDFVESSTQVIGVKNSYTVFPMINEKKFKELLNANEKKTYIFDINIEGKFYPSVCFNFDSQNNLVSILQIFHKDAKKVNGEITCDDILLKHRRQLDYKDKSSLPFKIKDLINSEADFYHV